MSEQQNLHAVNPSWVDAAPFRAHVRHAIAVAGVPWPAFAVESGVPVTAVRTLLFGRSGRHQPRIEPRIAARLLCLGAHELTSLRRTQVVADDTAKRLEQLLIDGTPPLALAQWCAISPNELARLVDGEAFTCSRLTECLSIAAERLAAAPALNQRAA